jgi:hypothetical protein
MTETNDPILITAERAIELLVGNDRQGWSKQTIHRLAQAGRLVAVGGTKSYRVTLDSVRQLAAALNAGEPLYGPPQPRRRVMPAKTRAVPIKPPRKAAPTGFDVSIIRPLVAKPPKRRNFT